MGFVGSLVVIALFVGLFLRVIYLSERQKQSSVEFMAIALLVFYFFVNIAMVIGVFQQLVFHYHSFFLWWVWLVGIYYFTVYIPENGCQ
jgi:hypothetical protein